MSHAGGQVLIIDDSLSVRRFVETVLNRRGYVTHSAGDGQQGLELARAILPDLILVDFVMPVMPGHTFCKRVRADPRLHGVPIVLFSSKGDSVGVFIREMHDNVHQLAKPFEADVLLSTVRNLIGPPPERKLEQPAPMLTSTPFTIPLTLAPNVADAVVALPVNVAAPAPPFDAEQLAEHLDRAVRRSVHATLPALVQNAVHDALKHSGVIEPKRLYLAGSLSELALPDVLNFAQSTSLPVRISVLARDLIGEIFVERGRFVFSCVRRRESTDFLSDLILSDTANPDERRAILEALRDARLGEMRLGEVLVQKGVMTQAKLMDFLRIQALEALHTLLEVSDGRFVLEHAELPAQLADITFRIPLAAALMDGLRLLDEKQHAERELADENLVLVRRTPPDEALASLDFTAEELQVLEQVDGKRPLGALLQASRLPLLQTKRILYRFSKVGLVRPRKAA